MSGWLAKLLALVMSLSPGKPGKGPAAPASPPGKPATAKLAQVKAKVAAGTPGACVQDCPLATGPFVSADYASKTTQVGNGYCVPFVQEVTPVGVTKTWTPGANLAERPDIKKGTAIATFNAEGKYASNSSGNHAAIFEEYGKEGDKEGFYVYDQYRVWGPKPEVFNAMTPEEQAAKKVEFSQYDEGNDRYFKVKPPSRRFIKFDNAGGGVSNNGDAYSVIEH